ncbi:hypothetical protein SteCoe_22172 [Stentor coeruleus]|uniref:Uncharacterized protein n=1 Tax=Stentor coeruleus TaxID=5963 RepID=A0A1R2BMX4_9CILI|nr:hypothetical protein SteCoe_22172 [Stentor coeruleus]
MDSKNEAFDVENDIKVTNVCCEGHGKLEKIIEEKEIVIRNLNAKLKKIAQDFNYNVQLIYERDREIDVLNEKIDKLIAVNREKDLEIFSLKGLHGKVKRLEYEKYLLNKRIESFLEYEQKPSVGDKKNPIQKLENFALVSEYRTPTHKKHSTYGFISNDMIEGKNSYADSIINKKRNESNFAPLTKLNLDLENRIRALEQEDNKNVKHHKRSNTESNQKVFDIFLTKEITVPKEKKINEIYKSSLPLKPEHKYRDKCEVKDLSLNLLTKDIEDLRNEFESSRIWLLTESGDESEQTKYGFTERILPTANKN